MRLFKYMSQSAAEASLAQDDCFTLRFALPESFNDPYELFLMPDAPLSSVEERAYFEGFLKQLPQAPVTCFSHRPESVVMWAHYGQLSTGLCLSVDEDRLFEELDAGYIHDVEYTDKPVLISSYSIKYACTTKKNRHTLSLLSEANRNAYFRKRSSWSYEQERRLVVGHSEVIDASGMMLRSFPARCLDSVIVGPRATVELRQRVAEWCAKSGVAVLHMYYSRRVADPFFRTNNSTVIWNGTDFVTQRWSCGICFEPLKQRAAKCEWCKISDNQLAWAINSNMTMACLRTGVMESLPLSFADIRPRGRKIPTQEGSQQGGQPERR